MRAYLQVACAGLGFDIGEVWWTADQNGSSTVAAIGMLRRIDVDLRTPDRGSVPNWKSC